MPKPGYTNLIVKEEIRSYLERLAKAEGFCTVSQLLEAIIRVDPKLTGVYPGVNPTALNGGSQVFRKDFKNSCFSKTGKEMADPEGFEPPTPGLGGRCPIRTRPRVHVSS